MWLYSMSKAVKRGHQAETLKTAGTIHSPKINKKLFSNILRASRGMF